VSRLETKFRLIRELGSMFDPVQRLLFNDANPEPSRAKLAVATAQLISELGIYSQEVAQFCTINQLFIHAYFAPIDALKIAIMDLLRHGSMDRIRREFPEMSKRLEAAVLDIPADDPDVMLPPESPFQTYLRLLAICGVTTTRLQLFDPYLDAEVFDRYLPDVGKGVEITLVTDVANMRTVRRRDRIVAISELIALERPTTYRLLEAPSLHDRKIRSDDKIFDLGGSMKDASKKDFYTITSTDGNSGLQATLDQIIAASYAWYQPGMTMHRRWCSICKQISDVQKNGACTTCGNLT